MDLEDEPTMQKFQKVMDEVNESFVRGVQALAEELNCSDSCALDVMYLRSRSRHTQELEDELIKLHLLGNPPNIMEFDSKYTL